MSNLLQFNQTSFFDLSCGSLTSTPQASREPSSMNVRSRETAATVVGVAAAGIASALALTAVDAYFVVIVVVEGATGVPLPSVYS